MFIPNILFTPSSFGGGTLRGLDDFGREWLRDNLSIEMLFGDEYVIEPSEFDDIFRAATDCGLALGCEGRGGYGQLVAEGAR